MDVIKDSRYLVWAFIVLAHGKCVVSAAVMMFNDVHDGVS
jgi:hypothetical protein